MNSRRRLLEALALALHELSTFHPASYNKDRVERLKETLKLELIAYEADSK